MGDAASAAANLLCFGFAPDLGHLEDMAISRRWTNSLTPGCAWPILVNLRADPYEKMPFESQMYVRWYADNMWLFVPIGQKVKEFLATIPQYPFKRAKSCSLPTSTTRP